MGKKGDDSRETIKTTLADQGSAFDGDPELLEAVLHETMDGSSREALDLIFEVARASEYEDTSHIGAVEEVVEAIVKKKFGVRLGSKRLVQRVASTLIETPEATIKLERLWQEARARG